MKYEQCKIKPHLYVNIHSVCDYYNLNILCTFIYKNGSTQCSALLGIA
jgi:hypothetical protein